MSRKECRFKISLRHPRILVYRVYSVPALGILLTSRRYLKLFAMKVSKCDRFFERSSKAKRIIKWGSRKWISRKECRNKISFRIPAFESDSCPRGRGANSRILGVANCRTRVCPLMTRTNERAVGRTTQSDDDRWCRADKNKSRRRSRSGRRVAAAHVEEWEATRSAVSVRGYNCWPTRAGPSETDEAIKCPGSIEGPAHETAPPRSPDLEANEEINKCLNNTVLIIIGTWMCERPLAAAEFHLGIAR